MAKITLTADEELQYMHTLDKLQDLMPELEIEIITTPVLSRIADNNYGDAFRKFLKADNTTIVATPAYKQAS